MPQHKSAQKRVRQSARRRERNQQQRKRMRTMAKKLRNTTDKEQAETLLRETKAYLDRLATRGVIHKNKAANYKSGLERHVNSLS